MPDEEARDAMSEQTDEPVGSGTGTAGLSPAEVRAELDRLKGTRKHFPAKKLIAEVPGLRASIEETGGVEFWARELGVAPPGMKLELTAEQVVS